ncbi:MAG: hypothetical protein ACR2FN_02635 [Chitinophagaceae bacterium]
MRLIAIIIIIPSLFHYLKNGKSWQKIMLILVLPIYGAVAYAFNFRFSADKMFYQPKEKLFSNSTTDTANKNKLIIGVAIGGEAKAYPIEILVIIIR